MDGCSDVIMEVFGKPVGYHARSAIGTSTLPIDISVEVEAVVQIKPEEQPEEQLEFIERRPAMRETSPDNKVTIVSSKMTFVLFYLQEHNHFLTYQTYSSMLFPNISRI